MIRARALALAQKWIGLAEIYTERRELNQAEPALAMAHVYLQLSHALDKRPYLDADEQAMHGEPELH